MPRKGWRKIGNGSNLAIAEVRLSGSEVLTSYQEAKEEALVTLRNHVQPYLDQMERLESDNFAATGRLPELKAWELSWYGRPHTLVFAKTKKRAIELVEDTRYGFEESWEPCEGTWWYEHGVEEGVFVEETDENNRGTGVFLRPLSREEKDEFAEQFIAPYRTMSAEKLQSKVGRKFVSTGEGRHGTPFRATVTVEESYHSTELWVHAEVDDGLGYFGCGGACFHRKVPVSESCNWIKKGF
jgi:hypothetical protein